MSRKIRVVCNENRSGLRLIAVLGLPKRYDFPMSPESSPESRHGPPRLAAARFLEGSLLFTLIAHAIAMASMLLLLPGMPGGPAVELADRASFVAHHPWIWRIGWLPWQITALSDLILAVALLRTEWMPKLPALLTLLVTLAAMIPDQTGQVLWTWIGPSIARTPAYGEFESRTFRLIAGWATIGYIAGALGWTWCFAVAGVWSRNLTRLSWIVWPIFAATTVPLMLRIPSGQSPALALIVSLGNAIAFVLLIVWLAAVTEKVLRRSRPNAIHGRYAVFRYPSNNLAGRLCNCLANSRLAFALGGLLPMVALESDITDVVYVNYLVDADSLERFVDEPLKLQRLGPAGRYAMFTFLTFRHGHFGPRFFGIFRRIFPSPIQSNWRIHVHDPLTGKRGIQFLSIANSFISNCLAARLLAENVPMHLPAIAAWTRGRDGVLSLRIDPGSGSAPDVAATFRPCAEPPLAHPWDECFGTWRRMLEYCVPQDRAMSSEPWRNRVSCQEITLNIPLDDCRPMEAAIVSQAAAAIAGESAPFCFHVASLQFRFIGVQHDKH